MARRRMTAQQAAEKWKRRMQTAGEDYAMGVRAVTESPTAAAAAAAPKYAAGVQRSVDEGRFQRGLEKVSLQEWKDKSIEKGQARLASGAAAAEAKVQDTMGKIMTNVDEVLAIVERMPTDTPEQRMQRALVWMQEMHNRPVK